MPLPLPSTTESPLDALTRLQPALQGYALAITADHQLAEDAFQEVAAIVSSRPAAVPAGPDALRWLREVTRRKALEVARRARRGGALLSRDVLEQLAPSFVSREEPGDELEALGSCLDELTPEQRSILDGRYREALSATEIASLVGRSVQGVYAVMKRVRGALLECMRRRLARPDARAPHREPRGAWNEVMGP